MGVWVMTLVHGHFILMIFMVGLLEKAIDIGGIFIRFDLCVLLIDFERYPKSQVKIRNL